MADNDNWPFADPKNVYVFTTTRITKQNAPILLVTHDDDDGAWQFLDGGDVTEEIASIVSLFYVFKLDPTIGQLAKLPYGWKAWRETKDSPWQAFNGLDER